MGFVDEMAIDANANTARLWSFGKPAKKVATYVKTKVTGFYSINGENVIDFPESNKTDEFITFLKKVREANPGKRIVIILDNFRTHHAKKVKEEAERMNIALVYLPPYSPDLNPVEFVWKCVKRIVSEKSPLNKESLRGVIERAFIELTKSISFAENWIEKFLRNKFSKLCT